MQSTASVASRHSSPRTNGGHNHHANTEQNKDKHDDVADEHCCFSLKNEYGRPHP